MVQPIKRTTRLNKDPISIAKRVPIISLLPSGTIQKRSGNKIMVCCPIHNEKNPSMAIYETNTFNCFACSASGDSISFYMQLHEVGFKEALEELSK